MRRRGHLSPRVREALQHRIDGHSLTETATLMGVRPNTPSMYQGRTVEQLGAQNILQAVAIAVRAGILDVSVPENLVID